MKNQSHFQIRRDTAANWAAANPVLKSGEPGFVTDTGELKMGNGIAAFNDLPALGAGSGEGAPIPAEGQAVAYVDVNVGLGQEEGRFEVLSTTKSVDELCLLADDGVYVVARLFFPGMSAGDFPLYVQIMQYLYNEDFYTIVFAGIFGEDLIALHGSLSGNEEEWNIGVEELATADKYSDYKKNIYQIFYREIDGHLQFQNNITYKDLEEMLYTFRSEIQVIRDNDPTADPLKLSFVDKTTIENDYNITINTANSRVAVIYYLEDRYYNDANAESYITRESFPEMLPLEEPF